MKPVAQSNKNCDPKQVRKQDCDQRQVMVVTNGKICCSWRLLKFSITDWIVWIFEQQIATGKIASRDSSKNNSSERTERRKGKGQCNLSHFDRKMV